MKYRILAYLALPLAMLPASVMAQSPGYSISGGLSNFDVTNQCDTPCDEFEIEIEGVRPADVYHCYHNGNYGAPFVSDFGAYTRVRYHHPQHQTPVGTIEHFGVSLRGFSPANTIRVRWLRHGQPATVNGVVPSVGGGSTPATQPILPSIVTETVQVGNDNRIVLRVINNDPAQAIWVQRRARITGGEVTLEALMPDDPLVVGSVLIDNSPVFVAAGQTLVLDQDLFELEDLQSAVFAASYFQDLLSAGGPFGGGPQHVRGPQLGNVMTASIAGRDLCAEGGPTLVQEPEGVDDSEGAAVDLSVSVEGGEFDPIFEWRKDGQPIADGPEFAGVNSDTLHILALTPDTKGIYHVIASNACGRVVSQAAPVRIIGDEGGGGGPDGCALDFNDDGLLSPDDLDEFITTYFDDGVGRDRADFTGDGIVTPDDLDDFITQYFEGCN